MEISIGILLFILFAHMKNLKKLFASVASLAIFASSLSLTTVFGAASYSDELQGAYDYAYNLGITTQSSIDSANMYGSLIRSNMAKMMVNFAKEVFNQTPDTSLECSFTDLNGQSQEMKDYIKEACQMGLMGQGITAFNPNGAVTRAQFGTVLSRVLRGTENEGGTPYYAKHLKALNDAGIMNNISNPMANEIRGYVMLMMERADDSSNNTPAICETPENQTACSLGLDTCPTECVDNSNPDEVKAGDLQLSLASGTPADMTSIPQAGIVNFASIDFEAGSEMVKVNSVTVTRLGLGQRADISRIYFERDGVRVSGRAALSTDNTAVISFSPALQVKANGTEKLDLVVNVDAASAGGEHSFKVTNVNSSAASASYNITTPTLRTSSYQVGKVEFKKLGSPQAVRAGETNVELGQFRLSNTSTDNKELKVKAITVRQNESADLANLEDLAIYRDGDKVSTDVVVNGKEVTFALNTKLTDGQSAIFYIRGTVTTVDNAGEKYQFTLRNAEDLNVAEYTTNFRASVKGDWNITFVSTPLDVYTAEGADIMLSRDSAISSSIQVTPGANDAILMKGSIKVNAAINLEDLKLNVTPNAGSVSDTITKLTLKVGSATSTWTPSTAAGVQQAQFDGTFAVNSTSNIVILADIRSTATDTRTIQIETLDLTKFTVREYVSTQNTISATSIAGNITAPLATVNASKLNIARTDGLSNRTVVKWANDLLLGKARLTTSAAGSIRVSSLTLENVNATPADYTNKVSVTMYINGTAVSTRNLTSPTLTFSSLPSSATVTTANPLDIEFRGNIDQTVANGKILALQINSIQSTDNNGQTVVSNPTTLNLATIAASAGGVVAFSSNSNTPGASLLAGGLTDVEIAKFNVNATDDNLKLTDLYLAVNAPASTIDLGQRLSNIQLMDGATVLANGVILDGGSAVGFENLSSSNFVITAGNAKTLTVKATINNLLNSTDVAGTAWLLQLVIKQPTTPTVGTVNGARFVSESNGNLVTPTVAWLVVSNLHKVVRGKVLVSPVATTATETRLLNFTVTAEGNRTTLNAVNFTLRNNAAAGSVKLYKNSVSAANQIGTVATVGAAWANAEALTITLGTPEEIAASSTANYILEIVGYVPSAIGTNLLSRQFQLDDVSYGDIFNDTTVVAGGLFNYVNAGNFPLTAPSYTQ